MHWRFLDHPNREDDVPIIGTRSFVSVKGNREGIKAFRCLGAYWVVIETVSNNFCTDDLVQPTLVLSL